MFTTSHERELPRYEGDHEATGGEVAVSRTSANTDTAAAVRLPAEEMPLGVEIDCRSYEITEQEIIEFGTR